MLLNLKTGRVDGYNEGQEPIIYLVSSVQAIAQADIPFVFTDGHGLATFTEWFANARNLDAVDWNIVGERYWSDRPDDNDRKRRKQAEFLVQQAVPWDLITEIGVYSSAVRNEVMKLLSGFPNRHHPPVNVRAEWYYY